MNDEHTVRSSAPVPARQGPPQDFADALVAHAADGQRRISHDAEIIWGDMDQVIACLGDFHEALSASAPSGAPDGDA